jgi:hypothetical protein
MLQKFGSKVVNKAAGTDLPDAASGFRAYSRESLMLLNTITRFSYCMETIIQAGNKKLKIGSVPITTNPKTRESRLFPSTAAYVRRNALSIFRVYSQHQPLKVFWSAAAVMGVAALALFVRFIVLFITHSGHSGHVQSLIAGAVLFNTAMLLGALGVIGDLLDAQRMLSQRTFERVRRIELQLGVKPSHYEPGTSPAGAAESGESGDRQALEV